MLETLSTYAFPPGGIACYYHTASVRNALDILVHNHLFGSFPSRVNDPDDLRIQIENLDKSPYLKTRGRGLDLSAIQEGLNKEAKAIMDRTYRFACFAEASKVDSDKQSELRFWNEYANHFKGVRFKFVIDKDFLITPSAEDTFVGKIIYNGHSATIDASYVQHISDFARLIASQGFLDDLCYFKSPDWMSEYEFRLGSVYTRLHLEMSRITSKEERFFVFNPFKLLEVVVGYRADEEDIGLLKVMTKNKNVQLRKAVTDLRYEAI